MAPLVNYDGSTRILVAPWCDTLNMKKYILYIKIYKITPCASVNAIEGTIDF